MQPNKRDLKNAVSLDTVKKALGDDPNLGDSETVATLDRGIRETFVRAVGVALERVSCLMDQGTISTGRPEIDSGEQLLRLIEAAQHRSQHVTPELDSPIGATFSARSTRVEPKTDLLAGILAEGAKKRDSEGMAETARERQTQKANGVPTLPAPGPAPGTIWPPVAGPIILHEIEASQSEPERRPDGVWLARAVRRWCLRFAGAHFFETLPDARKWLVEYSRLHKALENRISGHRCVALVPEGEEGWRLWQVVRTERHLGCVLQRILMEKNASVLASQMLDGVELLINAAREFIGDQRFADLRPDTTSLSDGKPAYTGMLSFANGEATEGPSPAGTAQLLRDQLGALLQNALPRCTADISRTLGQLKRYGLKRGGDREMIDTLSALMIGH